VGSGSGYLCAVFHHLIEENGGLVVGIESIPQLLAWSKENIINAGLGKALENGGIEMFLGDGTLGEYANAAVSAVVKPSIVRRSIKDTQPKDLTMQYMSARLATFRLVS
jgi:protein-L-isoaspartate O-methyltransferase